MIKCSLFAVTLLFMTRCNERSKSIADLNGIWIPESIYWDDGTLSTFYFYYDSSFVLLSSSQKLINDSIFFQAEPGFTIAKGRVNRFNEDTVGIGSVVLYRFMAMPGDSTPSAARHDVLLPQIQQQLTFFEYQGVRYVKTKRYARGSEMAITDIATALVPDLERKYGLH